MRRDASTYYCCERKNSPTGKIDTAGNDHKCQPDSNQTNHSPLAEHIKNVVYS
ncbi:hypothetical protein MCEMIEM28_02190 [Burkholderiaceae bacterium]